MRSAKIREPDDVVFAFAAVSLGCGVVAAAAAGFAFFSDIFMVFATQLAWLLLAPAVFVVLLGLVGLVASCSFTSKAFRSQLASFLIILAVLMSAVGVYVAISSQTSAKWVSDGCEVHSKTGLWNEAGRLADVLKRVQNRYQKIWNGWATCRALDPLIYDLKDCGARASYPDGGKAEDQDMYSWFQRIQLSFHCGGFCDDDVPLFGPTSMAETLQKQTACAKRISNSLSFLGKIVGGVVIAASLPVGISALALFCASQREPGDFIEIDMNEGEGDELEDVMDETA